MGEVLTLARRAGVAVRKWFPPSARTLAEANEIAEFPAQLPTVWIAANLFFWTATQAEVKAYLACNGVEAAEIASRRGDRFHLPLTVTTHSLREALRLAAALRRPDQPESRQSETRPKIAS